MAVRGARVDVTVPRPALIGWLADRSVIAKALTATAVAMVVAASLGTLSIIRMAEISDDLRAMKSTHVDSQRHLGELRGATADLFRGLFLLSNEQTTFHAEGRKNVETADAQVAKALAAYRALEGGSPERTAAIDTFADAWTRHADLRNVVFLGKPLAAGASMPAPDQIGPTFIGAETEMRESVNALIELETRAATALVAEGDADYLAARDQSIVTIAVGLLLVLAIAVWTARTIRRQLRGATAALTALADGDLSGQAAVHSRDELGQITHAVNQATSGLRDLVRALTGGAATVADSTGQLTAVATRIGASAQEASAQADLVASAASDVSGNVQTVAAGSQEMGSSIREISQNANDAAAVAAEAVTVAESTNQTVSKLGESSAEIGNVVKVITSIAGQTNLLALNATIEAARAGEAGRGFAVVANEVKDLAQETARATEDISRRVEAIQSDTTNAVAAIGEIGQIIARINDYQLTIASAVEEQTATTGEMSRSVNEAANGATDIAANINGVADATRATTSTLAEAEQTIAELTSVATDLQAVVSRFRL